MEIIGPKYIGRVLDLRTLRAYILDQELTEEDTLLLHPENFGDVVLEHRTLYREPMADPFYLLGVLLDEASEQYPVPRDRVKVLRGDTRPQRLALAQAAITIPDDGRTLYRCGTCRGLVTPDGLPIEGALRAEYSNWLKLRENQVTVAVAGDCCQ